MLSQSTSTGLVSLLAVAGTATADILFATSYNDASLNVLELNGKSLKVTSQSFDCGGQPTWMTLDFAKKVLYCLNEGWDNPASITSYRTGRDGKLETLDKLLVTKSPVASTLYGPGNSGLAVAH